LRRNSVRNAIKSSATLFLNGLPRLRRRVSLISFVIATFWVGGMFVPMGHVMLAESGQADAQSPADLHRPEGRWVRPDGGYVLELSEIKKDGSLNASYFNPRPIKVFSAKWSQREGKIHVFVELRDVNYPGSTYNLQYEPGSDRLKGTYFQAVEKQTYNIEFVRVK